MKKKLLFLRGFIVVLALTIWSLALRGQNQIPGYRISGSVVDSASGQALEFVTVALNSEGNQTVKADYSKADGSFLLAEIKPGTYSLVLTIIGYQNLSVSVNLGDSTGVTRNLGMLRMTSQSFGLSEVVVKAAKPIVTQEIDRLSYDLQADPDSKVFTALEMMRKVPFLSLDGEENILLKGSRNYRIFVNGKPSGLVERNPNEVLRSMPAASIARIEVITNPPARYDAEGMAGIIDIITHKSLENGYRGSITLSERFPVGGPGLGGSLSAQLGKFGVSLLGGAASHTIPLANSTLSRSTSSEEVSTLHQIGTRRSRQRSGYIGYELSYEISERQLISSQLSLNGSRTRATTTQRSMLQITGEDFQAYNLEASNALSGSSLDASLNYQLGFKRNKEQFLTLSYRYYGYDDSQRDEVDLENLIHYEVPNYHQLNNQSFAEQSFQLDFVSPFKKVTSEAGLKVILRDNSSNFQYRFLEGSLYETNPALSNRFRYHQDVLSVYNSYEYAWGSWGLRAGARIEQTLIKADFFSTESEVDQRYTNFIPSLALSRKLGGNGIVKIAYVQQISRPSIQRLNPFVDRSNPNVETSGNPNLRPYTFNRVQLSYGTSGKASVNLGLDYTFVRNIDFRITTFDSLANITRSTYENTGSGDAVDLSFSIRLPVSKNWDIHVNGMLSSIWAVVGNEPSRISSQIIQTNFTASSAYRFPDGWRISAGINPVTRSFRSPQEQANGFIGSTLGITKDLVAGKLSASAMVANPFTRYRKNILYTIDQTFTQYRNNRDYFRSFSVNLTYNFGRLKEQIKKNRRGIKNDDIVK